MTAPLHDGDFGTACSPTCAGCAAMRPPERKPAAGWTIASPARMTMTAHHLTATVRTIAPVSWDVSHHIDTRDGRCLFAINFGDAPTIADAQLAAEDALRAIAEEILRAVGA